MKYKIIITLLISIIFIGSAGQVFAINSGTAIMSDIIGLKIQELGCPIANYIVFFNDDKSFAGFASCNHPFGTGIVLNSFGDIWSDPANLLLLQVADEWTAFNLCQLPGYDTCLADTAIDSANIALGNIPPIPVIIMPIDATGDMLDSIGVLFADLWIIITIAIGIPISFYIIRKVIALVPKK